MVTELLDYQRVYCKLNEITLVLTRALQPSHLICKVLNAPFFPFRFKILPEFASATCKLRFSFLPLSPILILNLSVRSSRS